MGWELRDTIHSPECGCYKTIEDHDFFNKTRIILHQCEDCCMKERWKEEEKKMEERETDRLKRREMTRKHLSKVSREDLEQLYYERIPCSRIEERSKKKIIERLLDVVDISHFQ